MNERKITGNLVNAYYICHRKLWLFAHEINPSTSNPYLEIGRLIGENSYEREKKEILMENIKIDLIKKESGNIVVAEVKKSSKGLKAAKMQLLFYLYKLKQKSIEAKGELLIPKEKRKILIKLDDKSVDMIEKAVVEINNIINMEKPPPVVKTNYCKKCAYYEFCWV